MLFINAISHIIQLRFSNTANIKKAEHFSLSLLDGRRLTILSLLNLNRNSFRPYWQCQQNEAFRTTSIAIPYHPNARIVDQSKQYVLLAYYISAIDKMTHLGRHSGRGDPHLARRFFRVNRLIWPRPVLLFYYWRVNKTTRTSRIHFGCDNPTLRAVFFCVNRRD